MVFPGKWWVVCLVLFLGTGAAWAEGVSREQRAFDAGVQDFHDAAWPLAEMDFSQFAQKYPDSKLLPEAGLFQAQALIKQNKFILAEELLLARKPSAGALADDYTYWLGEAQFQAGAWREAADTLASLPPGSPRALAAAVSAGAALAKLQLWPMVAELLQSRQSLFQAAAQTDPDNELVLRGRLLLAQAQFGQHNFAAAGSLLSDFKPATLPPDLEWQRIYLLARVKLSANDPGAALPLTTELVRLAGPAVGGDGGDRPAASVALQARVLENLGRGPDAVVAWQANLVTNAPVDRQQEAILKIAELAIAQQQFTNAEAVLENYTTRFASSPTMAAAWLALGELYLQDYVAQPSQTNRLADARARFDALLTTFTNSPFLGKAYLDLGWCDWQGKNYAASLTNFQNAALNLPPSEDLAVARFKLADAQFAGGNYEAALSNYQAVVETSTKDYPRVAESLGDRAWYQSFRCQLELGHLGQAETTMERLATDYPQSALNETTALLLGEHYTDLRDPTNALAVFQSFKDRVPQSPLLPLVDLAVARAYEEDQRWPEALAQYAHWLKAYPTNGLLPQVMYSQAWANYQAGNDTNALMLFTNFVAQFPESELAPQAQWWVADYYFSRDSVTAELNYKAIFENPNWLTNALHYPAQLMAGQAAVSRTGNDEAIRLYFEKLEADTNCPLDLRVRATFAHGRALMGMESADTNDPTANYQKALAVFNTICTAFPTNDWGARAWGEMGDCYLQLTNYDAATNAFSQALLSAGTNVAVLSQASIGLGLSLEKQAALLPADGRKTLLNQALQNYLAVFNSPGPERDPIWTPKAGLQAADLASALGYWQQVVNLYASLGRQFPQLKAGLAAKAALATQNLNAPGQ